MRSPACAAHGPRLPQLLLQAGGQQAREDEGDQHACTEAGGWDLPQVHRASLQHGLEHQAAGPLWRLVGPLPAVLPRMMSGSQMLVM